MKREIKLRTARLEDVEEILAIYSYYVEYTAISFEYEIPSLAEFRGRVEKTLQKYPYIVAEKENEILGYGYTGPFVGRKAYDWAAETTIYLKHGKERMGLGKLLYGQLEEISRRQGIINLNACIGFPREDDSYLTGNSRDFHQHMGYRLVGQFYKCGYKFGRWYDMVWMEKCLGPHPDQPGDLLPFPALGWKEKILEI